MLASGKAAAVLIYTYRGGSMTNLLPAFFFPFFGFGFVMYFLPSIIALARSKRDITGIVLLNFFLGWTMIGWIVALVWAVKTDVPQVVR
jgi:Superinfection immunity protein